MHVISVQVTFPNRREADIITDLLVKENLVACANSHDVESVYTWDARVNKDKEVMVHYKTRASLWPTLSDRIHELHSYELPAVTRYDISVSEKYAAWVFDCTKEP